MAWLVIKSIPVSAGDLSFVTTFCGKDIRGTNGVQDILPPNMVSGHIDYFNLKKFENYQVQEVFFLKQFLRSSCEKGALYSQKKGSSLSQKKREI